jgi:DNA-directed RNA polymerase specialized sigma24 family protein
MERGMLQELEDKSNIQQYCKFASRNIVLSGFPTAHCLLRHLRDAATHDEEKLLSDEVLRELLSSGDNDIQELQQRLVLLVLIPAVHKTSRQIMAGFPSLARDDVAQHLLISILEILRSPSLRKQESHFAFTILRLMRRKSFRWAVREARLAPIEAPGLKSITQPAVKAESSFESCVLLREFLRGCLSTGRLTEAEHELLMLFKIQGVSWQVLAAREGLSEIAFRRRMQRIMEKLRRFTRSTPLPSAEGPPVSSIGPKSLGPTVRRSVAA